VGGRLSRIRTIKPEFCVSEQIAECSTSARLVFALMWMFCDDQGIHPAKAKTLRGEIFPLDESITTAHVVEWVGELLAADLLREYEVNGERFWIVTGWKKHQKIDKPSRKHPPPLAELSPNPPRSIVNASPPESKGVEGSREEGKESLASASASTVANHTPALPPVAALAEWPSSTDPRVLSLQGLCLGYRCQVSAAHAQQWVSDGLTEAELREALDRAKAKKPGMSFPIGFLQHFVLDVRNGVGGHAQEPRGKDAIALAVANLAVKEANAAH
jgi:hypothetical protein